MRSDMPPDVAGDRGSRRSKAKPPASDCATGVCGDDVPPVVGSVLTGTGLTIAQAAARLERGEDPPLSDVQRAVVERWLAERPTG